MTGCYAKPIGVNPSTLVWVRPSRRAVVTVSVRPREVSCHLLVTVLDSTTLRLPDSIIRATRMEVEDGGFLGTMVEIGRSCQMLTMTRQWISWLV